MKTTLKICNTLSIALILLVATASILFAGSIPTAPTDAGKIYFIPVGKVSSISMDELAAYYQKKFNLTIEILPKIELNSDMINVVRQQLIAETLVDVMKATYAEKIKDGHSILIGITDQDMYIEGQNWRFAFAYREEDRFGVVSAARMTLPNSTEVQDRREASNSLTYQSPEFINRVHKILTKSIGIMYYHLPYSDNPKSVLYSSIMGIDDLDRIGEDF